MSKRFNYTDPQLCTYDNNLSKDWFVYFDFTDTLTDKKLRKQFRGGINSVKNKEERLLMGNALKAYWKNELKAGWNPFAAKLDLPSTDPTIIEALTDLLALKKKSCGGRTMESYNYIIKLFTEWITANRLQKVSISKLDSFHARTYMDYLLSTKNYSNRTFNDHLIVLSTFFNCAVERDWIAKNPFKKISGLTVEIGRNIAYTDRERLQLRSYLKGNDAEMYYFTQFIYYCFIRRSELTRLKISAINFKTNTIIIPASASKNKRQESVVIPATFREILDEMKLEDKPSGWYIFGKKMQPGPDQYINYNHISSRHNKISKDLGIDTQKGLYSWKHSGACELYKVLAGDVYALMRQLRHQDLTTTQIYLKSLGLLDNTSVRLAVW